MRVFTSLSLRRKVALVAVAITVLNVGTMIIFNAIHRFNAAEEYGLSIARSAALDAAARVSERLSLAMQVARTNGEALIQLHQSGLNSREQINAWFGGALLAHTELLAMYSGWEPNAFDGRDSYYAGRKNLGSNADGRFMPYQHWTGSRIELEPLVDYDQPGKGDYYLIPRDTGRSALIEPYLYPVGNQMVLMVSLVHPLVLSGKFVGISGVDLSLLQLQSELAKIRPFGVGHVAAYTSTGLLVAGPDSEHLGQPVKDATLTTKLLAEIASGKEQHLTQDDVLRTLLPLQVEGIDARWILDVQIPKKVVLADAVRVRNTTVGIGLLFILLDALLINWVVMRQTKPIDDLRLAVDNMGEDLTLSGKELGLPLERSDEIGKLARTFDALRGRLADSFSELESRVEQRTEQLEQMLERLKQTQNDLIQSEKLASLGAMVAGVAHELNTPIGNALTVSSTLRSQTKELSEALQTNALKRSQLANALASQHDMAALIEHSIDRAATLIVSFKQVAIDQTSERRREFDLREEIENVLAALRPSMKHDPWIIENIVPSGVRCDGFPGPLGQVLTNLIQNAVRHGFHGKQQGCITVSAKLDNEQLSLSVRDDGVGMDTATLLRIFEPFFTTKLGQGGSGLGLSISYRIASTILAGDLRAISTPGSGTTFILSMPLRTPGKL